jgi:hypothetical protein
VSRILLATRTLESSLPAWTTVGAMSGVGLCLCARGLNALCRKVRDPVWRVEQSVKRASGHGRRRRDVGLFAFSRWTRVGYWRGDWLAWGRWAAAGSLLGSAYVIIGEVLYR